MGKRPEKELRPAAALVAACLVLIAGRAGAGGHEAPAIPRNPGERLALAASDASRAAAPLLAQLWDSGFFRRNEAVSLEILNNDYAFLERGGPIAPRGNSGLACYSRGREGKDTIYLRKDLFSHFEIRMEGVIKRPDIGPRVLTVLVHEICHDLWVNILDDGERAAFTRQGEKFVADYRMALTPEDKRLFLLRAGDDVPDPRRIRSYACLDGMVAAIPSRVLCGQELFAWLAERFFSTKAMIPKPLRKYYACILTGIPSGEPKAPN